MNYRNFLIPAFILSLVAAGMAQTRVAKAFTAGGKTHYCVYYVPSGISKPAVVFYVHGAGGSGPNFENETKGDTTANKEKFIAVYPSASNTSGTGTWADMRGTSDFPFYLAILDTLDKAYSIDRDRVYMTGFSQGGFVSFVAGCSYSDIFAAIAPVSGHAGSPCTIKRPVSVYLTYGAQEDKVAFVKDLDIWLKLDSCPATPTVTRPYNSVTRVSYGPCAQGTYVMMDSISGQNHQWPNKMKMSDEVWTFFKKFSRTGSTAADKQRLTIATAAQSPVTASYSSGIVRLRGVGKNIRVRVLDTQGRQVAFATKGQFAFTTKSGGVYVVMVSENSRSTALKMVLP